MQDCFGHYQELREEMTHWLLQSMQVDGPGPNGGGEDEANYALAWFPHYLVTHDARVLAWLRNLLATLDQWVKSCCFHGYEADAEAHHGPEPFLLFLPRYLGLCPDDALARKLLIDAAHHIGNWIEGIPDWYDWQRHCFHGYRLGTRIVTRDPEEAYELAEHFRFLHIALAAYRVGGDDRYLDWAKAYGAVWASRIINAAGAMPLLWTQDGEGIHEADIQTPKQRVMAACAHHAPNDPLAGIENLLASGAIYVFGDLFRLTGDDHFRMAAKRIAQFLISELADPYADPGAAAILYYRTTFTDTTLDAAIVKTLESIPGESEAPLAMVFPQVRERRDPGIGRRKDMIRWGTWTSNGAVAPTREPSTATLALAYQMTGDVVFARRALRQAATKLRMARQVLRGGREHADMGGAICSVAAGHGRNWAIGAVTGCYGPLLLGTRDVQGQVLPAIEGRSESRNGLPSDVLSLVRLPVAGQGEVRFYNGGEAVMRFSWRPTNQSATWTQIQLAPGETHLSPLHF